MERNGGAGSGLHLTKAPASGASKFILRSCPTDKGARVLFRISDVFLPGPEELPSGLVDDTEREGAIVGFSDSGPKHHAFAVVELDDGQKMVVPVEKLRRAAQETDEGGGR